MNAGHRVLWARLGLIAFALAALEIGPRMGFGDAITLVPLSEGLRALVHLWTDGPLRGHAAATSLAVLGSFMLSAVTGVLLGLVLWRSRVIRRALEPYLLTYYAVPVFAFYPVLLTIFGFGLTPIIVISWLWSVVAVLTNTAIGFSQISHELIRLGRSLRLSGTQMFFRIYVPAAFPRIVTGLKLGATYSFLGVITSEFILASRGVGYHVAFSYDNFRVAAMYAGIYLVVIAAVLLNAALTKLERVVHGYQS